VPRFAQRRVIRSCSSARAGFVREPYLYGWGIDVLLARDLVLDGKTLGNPQIVSLRPYLHARSRVNQARRDSNALVGFAHASLQQKLNSKFLGDLSGLNGFVFVREA
jgi:hypothetical protein